MVINFDVPQFSSSEVDLFWKRKNLKDHSLYSVLSGRMEVCYVDHQSWAVHRQ